jgi:hypothetical protein
MFSLVSQKVLISPHAVAKCGVAAARPAFMGGLSPPLYWLIVSARCAKTSQILASTEYWRLLRYHWFYPNYSSLLSAHRRPTKKLVKAKNDHHHSKERGRGRWRSYQGKGMWVNNPPSSSCPGFHLISQFLLWSLFRLFLGCCKTSLDKYWIQMIRTNINLIFLKQNRNVLPGMMILCSRHSAVSIGIFPN